MYSIYGVDPTKSELARSVYDYGEQKWYSGFVSGCLIVSLLYFFVFVVKR